MSAACMKCGADLLFSARQRGDGKCGPCSRSAGLLAKKPRGYAYWRVNDGWEVIDAVNETICLCESEALAKFVVDAFAASLRRFAILEEFASIYQDESKEERWGPLLRSISEEVDGAT